jgi:translation initiation factor 4A
MSDTKPTHAPMSAMPHAHAVNVPTAAPVEERAEYVVKPYTSFDDMGIPEEILRGIYAFGFEVPSPIQTLAIRPMMERNDIIAQAQSGTGKTGTFCIGALSAVDPTIKEPQVLILAPTRELANQSATTVNGVSTYMGIKSHVSTGGPPIDGDIRALQRGAQVIVGTPGRVYDLIRRGALKLNKMRYLILDEADQMLEDRFREQVKCILEFQFPATCRIGLFSATMPPEVMEVAEKFLQNPVRILIPPENVTLDGIKQFYVNVGPDDKYKFDTLLDIYQHLVISQLIIFVNTKKRAEWLAMKMGEKGFTLECIHGEMDVAERKQKMDDFRRGVCRVLISTDLLARGIDVQQVSMVINYELPTQHENYIHRIGRSGRFGRKGVAINIICDSESSMMEEIVRYYGTDVNVIPENPSDMNNITSGGAV